MKVSELEKLLKEHIQSDKEFHEKISRVMFGDDEIKEKGIVEMIKEVHEFFSSAKNVGGFFGGLGNSIKWLALIIGAIGIIKGWWAGILAYLLK